VIERTVQLSKRVAVTEPRVLRRVTGSADIPAWVAAGAPVAMPDDKKPR